MIWEKAKESNEFEHRQYTEGTIENAFAGFCTVCGEKLKPGWKFCGNCGSAVENPGRRMGRTVKGCIFGNCPICGSELTERNVFREWFDGPNGMYEIYSLRCSDCGGNFKLHTLEPYDERTKNMMKNANTCHYLMLKAVNYDWSAHFISDPDSTTWLLYSDGRYKRIIKYGDGRTRYIDGALTTDMTEKIRNCALQSWEGEPVRAFDGEGWEFEMFAADGKSLKKFGPAYIYGIDNLQKLAGYIR